MAKRGGYIKLYRALSASTMWTHEKFTRGQAWVDLLLLANYAPGHLRVRDIRIEVSRGQVGGSAEWLAKRWKWSRKKVTRFLNELEKEQQIAQQKNNVTSLFTITNYERYQSKGTAEGTAAAPQRPRKSPAEVTAEVATRVALYKKKPKKKEQQQQEEPALSSVIDSGDYEEEPLPPNWLAVAKKLRMAGSELAERMCDEARANGCHSGEVERQIDHWLAHPGAWDIRILCSKVRHMVPGARVIWPEKSEDYVAAQATVAKTATVKKQIETRVSGEKAYEKNAAEKQDLEREWGQYLDTLPNKKLREFVEMRLPAMVHLIPPKEKVAGLLRQQILYELSVPPKGATLVSEVQHA